MSEITVPVKPTASAREISKWSMCIASLWIGGLSLVKAFWPLIAGPQAAAFGLEMGDIVVSGVALAAVFTPVYLSILVDKVREIKLGR